MTLCLHTIYPTTAGWRCTKCSRDFSDEAGEAYIEGCVASGSKRTVTLPAPEVKVAKSRVPDTGLYLPSSRSQRFYQNGEPGPKLTGRQVWLLAKADEVGELDMWTLPHLASALVMERNGWVVRTGERQANRWDAPRPRYRLTDLGRAVLEMWREVVASEK